MSLEVGDYVRFKHKPDWGIGKLINYHSELEHPWSILIKDDNGKSVILGFRSDGLIKITEEQALLWIMKN